MITINVDADFIVVGISDPRPSQPPSPPNFLITSHQKQSTQALLSLPLNWENIKLSLHSVQPSHFKLKPENRRFSSVVVILHISL